MQTGYPNIYAQCRHAAHVSQERWAEVLNVSPRSIKDYEAGRTTPPNTLVMRMIRLTGCDWLALAHLQATSGGLDVLPEVAIKPLPQAVIALINKILGFADLHRDRQLLQIAEDGIIDDEERPLYEAILQDIQALIGAALEVRYSAEYKKIRPEAATSRRSGAGLCV